MREDGGTRAEWKFGRRVSLGVLATFAVCVVALTVQAGGQSGRAARPDVVRQNADDMLTEGQATFRTETFGDEGFWTGAIGLHRAIEGEALGGVGPGLSPQAALGLGLKVDVDALPKKLVRQIRRGKVDLTA